MSKSNGDSKNTLYCSFCGKSQHEVRKLIAGPSVFICDECIDLCNEVLRDELPELAARIVPVRSLDGMPLTAEWVTRQVLEHMAKGQN